MHGFLNVKFLSKLVHQVPKNLSLLVTGEREVNCVPKLSLQKQLQWAASFTSLIYTSLLAKELGIRKI